MSELLRMEHISKRFGSFYANKDISLTVNCGEVLTLLGENGAASFIHDQMIAARDRGVGILLISADFDEILEMSDRILVCFEGQIMGEYSGKNPPIEEISLAMTGK